VKERLHQEPKGERYEGYHLTIDGLLMYNNNMYIPNLVEIKNIILDEFHKRPYVGRPSYQNMIMKKIKLYYWPRMKKDIAEYISRCLECQQVKVEHKQLAELLQPVKIIEWKWDYLHGIHYRTSKDKKAT
jgi:hypothetical protein